MLPGDGFLPFIPRLIPPRLNRRWLEPTAPFGKPRGVLSVAPGSAALTFFRCRYLSQDQDNAAGDRPPQASTPASSSSNAHGSLTATPWRRELPPDHNAAMPTQPPPLSG